MRSELGCTTGNAAEECILALEMLGEGRLVVEIGGDDLDGTLGRWSDIGARWPDECCDVESAILIEFVDDGRADAASWLWCCG